MKKNTCEVEPTPATSPYLQHGAVVIEFIPKNDKTKSKSEMRSEVQEILLQMYVRSRTRSRSKKREGEFADAA